MVNRIIVLIAISGIISLVSTMHGHAYANMFIAKTDISTNQIQGFYPTASLNNNQTTNREIMSQVKSQIENTDPFTIKGIDNQNNSINQSSTDDINSNDVISNDVKHIDNSDCKSNCPEKSKPTKYDIPFELPSIPFP